MLQEKVRIFVDGEDRTGRIRAYSEGNGIISITYNDGKTYSHNINNVEIKQSALSSDIVLNRFNYLKQLAQAVGLEDERWGNSLAKNYEKIDFLGKENMLSAFLSGELVTTKQQNSAVTIYPFGFNMSQKAAVDKALEYPLTIIEGPPGTGKTQTILNIIANAVMQGESVAVVSSNNPATKNVEEKLKKYQVDFIAAYLGNFDNRSKFIESQKPLPNLTDWRMSEESKQTTYQSLHNLYAVLSEMLVKQNELSKMRQELDAIELEYAHFCEYCNYSDELTLRYLKLNTTSASALELWLICEKYIESGKMPGFLGRLLNRFLRGVTNKEFYSSGPDMMISICQKRWYMSRISELDACVSRLQGELSSFDFIEKMNECSLLSIRLFRDYLSNRYGDNKRHQFELDDLWKKPEAFIKEYPVILSTAYSLRSSLSHRVMYDYIIIDESSQVDLAAGSLALSCARKAVIVGDLMQLPNVVDSNAARKTDAIFADFGLPEVYRYKNHSLLLSISEMFPNVPRTLLREHYRCHPKIIEFCNQKFYDNQLIVLTESKSDRQPLIVYKTVSGNHARDHVNQRQIDIIRSEIIPQQSLRDASVSVGIVTPYRNQTNALQEAFAGTGILADTVDKFQGRENDVIILSTVDNEISEFTDNANRLNVAVSRAIEQLIVVVNSGDDMRDKNIGDLVRYVDYNNLEIIQSEVYSVFDYLYKEYAEKRNELLSEQGRVSEYDSENLMHILICEVLANEEFANFDVRVHVLLKMIIRDMIKLDDTEKKYAQNPLTQVDFLIYDKFGKVPCLVIEVDGVAFHADGTRQAERDRLKNGILEKYSLPYLRVRTDGSGERERLIAALNEVLR